MLDTCSCSGSWLRAHLNFIDFLGSLPINVLVNLEVYVDESGTHNITGKIKSARSAVVCGFVGWSKDWKTFSRKWQSILQANNILSFHYYDLEYHRRNPADTSSRYYGWTEQRKTAFVKKLAKTAAHYSIAPVGGTVNTVEMDNAMKSGAVAPDYVYKYCIDQLFQSVREELHRVRPNTTDKIVFFFDDNKNRDWQNAVFDCYTKWSILDTRFAGRGFYDDKLVIPLQAADLIAGVTRKVAMESFAQRKPLPMDELCSILYQKMPNSAPFAKWIVRN